MKNKLRNKIGFLKKLKRPVQLRDQQLMHPEREWVIGLLITILLFVGAASISAYTYFSNQTIDVETVSDSAADTVYRESLVEEVLQSIKDRENRLRLLSRTVSPVAEVQATPEETASSTEIQAETASSTLE